MPAKAANNSISKIGPANNKKSFISNFKTILEELQLALYLLLQVHNRFQSSPRCPWLELKTRLLYFPHFHHKLQDKLVFLGCQQKNFSLHIRDTSLIH